MTDQNNQPEPTKTAEKKIREATFDSINSVARAIKAEPFDIEGAGRVWCHRRSNLQMKQWQQMQREAGGNDDLYIDARLIVICCGKENGDKIFNETHITRIVEWGQDIVGGLCRLCMKVNGMSLEGEEAIVKNSETTRTSGSSSGPRPGSA
jgi:hypothetical protein